MKRLLTILTIVISTLSPMMSFIQPVHADTVTNGAWTWTDISDQLTTRTNRPIWTVAYANGSWFYTDGQDLWNGGQVYRYDGYTQINITNDLRNAGVNRVDDIVSDGQTVLFLQDVVRLNNTLRVTAYTQNQYVNITSYIQSALSSNEGVNQIVGRNGTWYVTTTQGRLLRWNGLSTTPAIVSFPSNVNSYFDHSRDNAVYNVNHGSTNGYDMNIAIAPTSNNRWIVAFRVTNTSVFSSNGNNAGVVVYNFDGSNFSQLQQTYGNMSQLNKIASNGTQVYLFGRDNSSNPLVFATSGDSLSRTTVFSGTDFSNSDMRNISIAWNGLSWMIILNNKTVERFDGYSVTSYGRMRDYLTTASGDGNGRFLLGGTVSTINNDQPTLPLTAKLVLVTEGSATTNGTAVTSGGNFGGDRVYTSSNGPRVTIQGNPSGFRIGNGKEFAYRVSASDASGIDRIDVYVNGTRIKTCNDSVCEFRNTYYSLGSTTRTVSFYTRVTNRNGYSTDTSGSPDNLIVDTNSSATADGSVTTNTTNTQTSSGSGITNWTWLEPNTTALNSGDTTVYNVGAWDTNGINKIDIYVNGNIARTCTLYNATGNQTCTTSLYGSNYTQGTDISVNAHIFDGSGLDAWTQTTTIHRNNDNGSNSSNNSSDTSSNTWISISPNQTNIGSNETATFNVGAQDNNGINKIEIVANGNVIKTCSLGNSTSNQTCATSIYGSNYSAGTNIFVNAKVTDTNGNITWSDSRTFYRTMNSSESNTTNGTTQTWTWLDPNVTSLNANDSTTFTVGAQDNDGLSKIDLMANGSILKTCWVSGTGNQTCSTKIYASSYSIGTSIYLNAKVTDANGNASWTDSHTVTRTGANSTSNDQTSDTNTSNPDSINAWDWFDRSVDTLGPNATTAYHVGSWASRGIASVVIYVNGNVAKTCYASGTGNQDCSVTLNGSSYQAGTSIFVNGVAKSNGGATMWTTGKTITINGTSSNTGNETTSGTDVTNGWVSANSDHETGYSTNAAIAIAAAAYDPSGVARIDILANGSPVKTCTNSPSCSTVVSTSYYDTSFSYAAVMTDRSGNTITTGYKTIYKK